MGDEEAKQLEEALAGGEEAEAEVGAHRPYPRRGRDGRIEYTTTLEECVLHACPVCSVRCFEWSCGLPLPIATATDQ